MLALTLVLFIADATKNLGPPLLALLWLFYVGLDGGATGLPLTSRARRAALVTAGFIGLQACWWLVVQAVVLGQVASHNDPWRLMADAATNAGGWNWLTGWVAAYTPAHIANIADSHTGPSFLFVPGLAFLPRRAALWALTWVVIIALGIALSHAACRVRRTLPILACIWQQQQQRKAWGALPSCAGNFGNPS